MVVSVFLLSNFIATLMEPKVVQLFGLRGCVLLGSFFLAVGSVVKSGVPFFAPNVSSCPMIMLGTVLIGLSQPMYQCTPALLSSTWFPHNERTMATSIALNSNQLGIGASFAIGVLMVKKPREIPAYFAGLSIATCLLFLGVALEFREAPPTPPSASARASRGALKDNGNGNDKAVEEGGVKGLHFDDSTDGEKTSLLVGKKNITYQEPKNGDQSILVNVGYDDDDDDDDDDSESEDEFEGVRYELDFLRQFFSRSGFIHALVAFATSAVVINTVSTYMDTLLAARGHGRAYTGIVGFTFQIIVMISSFAVGIYTDIRRNYFTVTIVLLVVGAIFLTVCGYALDETSRTLNIWWMLLIIAATVGPLQPVATEVRATHSFCCGNIYRPRGLDALSSLPTHLCIFAFFSFSFSHSFQAWSRGRFPALGKYRPRSAAIVRKPLFRRLYPVF